MTPTGLVERAEELSQRIGRLRQFDELARQAEALKTRRDQLRERAALLTGLGEIKQRLVAAGIELAATSDGIGEARSQTAARWRAFSEDPLTATDPQDSSFRYAYLTMLNTIGLNVQSRLLQAWQVHLRAQVPELHEDLLSVVGRIGQLSQAVQEIGQLRTSVEQFAASLPQDDAGIRAALGTTRRLNECWAALPIEGIDASVMAFLRSAVESGGAPLAGLTQDVSAWLDEHGLLQSLRVSFR